MQKLICFINPMKASITKPSYRISSLPCSIVLLRRKEVKSFQRGISEKGRGDYDNNKLMRYEYYFKNPQLFVDLANKTVPFLNGGLFDCLDEKDKDLYYDGFSDREAVKKALIVPDYLFFGEEVGKNIDLSEWYGDKKKEEKSSPRNN